MDALNIVISGNSPEAFDCFTKLSESRHHVDMNQTQGNRPIDLLLIFDSFDASLKKSINDKTICFCFNPSLTLDFQFYYCHFEDPKNGEMQTHTSFIIDSEVHLISHKFSQVYGILSSIGYEIKFSESENSFVEPMLAASSIKQNCQKEREEIKVYDPNQITFHLIIALDCTGSMHDAIMNIKQSLKNIVSVISSEFKNILISFYAFRDYCDSKIIKKTLFVKQEDFNIIIDAISCEKATGGGDEPEAHKTCLATIKSDIEQHKQEMTNVCFFITDAPPHLLNHSGTYQKEKNELISQNLDFGYDWIELANSLLFSGIQIFSFITANKSHVLTPMSIMSTLTNGLCFIIPNDHNIFEKQMISIVSNLINNTTASVVDGIQMISPTEDPKSLQKELEMDAKTTKLVNDTEEIKTALIEKGQLMRLKPSDRGAKRVTISTAGLVETAIVAIKGLKALYKIINGDQSYYSFFDENPKFKMFSIQLKEANPNPSWLSIPTISCICSLMNIVDSFLSLNEIDEDDPKIKTDMTKIVEILGNFVIGYPILFQLSEDGKFNMQDAWPIIFKDASTAYTMSISSLYHILTMKTSDNSSNKMINKFKDFVASNERSGIVPVCNDQITKFALKILDITKWLDALVSYGIHRHIEPLPSITRATCCAFIVTISRQSFNTPKKIITESQNQALKMVLNTIDSLISLDCQSMMNEFKNGIEKQEISFNAFAPQGPYNCSGINKILNCFFQLRKIINEADHDFMVKFFYQGIHEYIGILQKFIKEDQKDEIINSIFDKIEIDTDNVTEQNPFENNDPSALTNFVYHIIEPHQICKSSVFLFKIVWNLLRNDEFEEPSQLMLIASFSQAISIQSRSFKYRKIEDESEDEKYEIKPIFATQDPIEILRVSCFLYFRQINAESILTLKENRKNYLIKEAIEKVIIPFRNCDIDEFMNALMTGFSLDWMEEPFKLSIVNSQDILTQLIEQIKRIEPNGKNFYENALYILALGKDKNEHCWMVGTCRNKDLVNQYINQFLNGDEEIYKYYFNNCTRPLPNRHGHHLIFCPYQETYTEEYARSRIICCIAPFYFIPELPKKVKPINDNIVFHLSRKINAPPLSKIYELAEDVLNEMKLLE